MKIRKITALIVASTMLISFVLFFSGCGNGEQPTATTTTTTTTTTNGGTEATTPEPPEEQTQYTFKFHTWYDEIPETNKITEILSDRVGHDIMMQWIAVAEYPTQLNILYMTNELPDVLISCGCAGETRDFVTTEVTGEDIKRYMPNYWARFVELQGSEREALLDLNSRFRNQNTGKVQGIPTGDISYTLPHAHLWRADIIEDELGLEIPKSLDEVEAVFAAFKAKYPNKYPYSPMQLFGFFDVFVAGAYGISTLFNPWQMVDGELTLPQYTENYKQTIARLAKWYENGYIDPEYILNDNQQEEFQKFRQGDLLLTSILSFWDGAPSEMNPDGQEAIARQNNPNAKVAYAPPLRPEPIATKYTQRVWSPFPGWQTWISDNASKDKDSERFGALLGVLDTISSDKELYMLCSFGIEGEHYMINDVGIPEFIGKFAGTDAVPLRREEGIDAAAFHLRLSVDRFVFDVRGEQYEIAWNLYTELHGWDAGTYKKEFVIEFGPPVVLPEGVTFPEEATVFGQVHNFITGEWPLAQYDSWLESLKEAAGYDTVIPLGRETKLPYYELNLN